MRKRLPKRVVACWASDFAAFRFFGSGGLLSVSFFRKLLGKTRKKVAPTPALVYPCNMRNAFAGLFALTTLSIYAFGAEVVRIVKEPGAVAMAVERGYGIQKDGKHELTFTSVATGKTLKVVKSFKGTTAKEDAHYFNQVNAIELPGNSGKVRVSGRIFYCSFEQKFCSVQRVDKEL